MFRRVYRRLTILHRVSSTAQVATGSSFTTWGRASPFRSVRSLPAPQCHRATSCGYALVQLQNDRSLFVGRVSIRCDDCVTIVIRPIKTGNIDRRQNVIRENSTPRLHHRHFFTVALNWADRISKSTFGNVSIYYIKKLFLLRHAGEDNRPELKRTSPRVAPSTFRRWMAPRDDLWYRPA